MMSALIETSQSKSLDLQVIAYDRGNHPITGNTQPRHWIIFAHCGASEQGTAYQLKGMPGGFRYEGPERRFRPSDLPGSRQEVDIGRVPLDKIHTMESIIAEIPISKAESDYNCQTWTEDVLCAMQPQGWVDMDPSVVVQWLKAIET